MSTYVFLGLAHEYRSIIWFFVFLGVLALLMFGFWFFADHADENESTGLLAPDSRLNDDWD